MLSFPGSGIQPYPGNITHIKRAMKLLSNFSCFFEQLLLEFRATYINIYKIRKLREAIFSVFFNIC